ncbi:hypothetical protein ACFL2V_04160 [Pseudomonadota bacterium]
MENYRVVGTFSVHTKKNDEGKTNITLKRDNKPAELSTSYQPVDITQSYSSFQPINLYSTYSEHRGFMWGQIKLAAGDIWPDWDGQRIILEAGPGRVIYMKHGGDNGRRIFTQPPTHFITNVTTDTFNRKSAERTTLTKRLAEWEVHFLTGFLGAAHWVGLAAVLGTDVLQQIIGERKRNTAYKEAARDIVDVDNELKEIAPVLRGKIREAILGGVKSKPGEKAKTFAETLPQLMINDDKTTGRIAGAVAAKFLFDSKNNNLVLFFILQTIATQTALKGATKIPPALGKSFQESFDKMMPNLENIDPSNPTDQKALVGHMTSTFNELGVSVSMEESAAIAAEIRRNPERIASNMKKLGGAFEKLAKAGKV